MCRDRPTSVFILIWSRLCARLQATKGKSAWSETNARKGIFKIRGEWLFE